jgi:Integrase core domain
VYVERLIGTIRRECLDHVIVFGEAHLRRILGRYAAYYNESRIHRSLDKDAPFHRAIERFGVITACPRRPSSPILQNLVFGTHNVSRRKGAPECSELASRGRRQLCKRTRRASLSLPPPSLTRWRQRLGEELPAVQVR